MEVKGGEIIQDIINHRLKYDSEIFFVDTKVVSTEFNMTIIKKKQYYGVSLNSEIVIPPIYDEIVVLTHSTVAIKIKNRISLYNIYRKKTITDFSYNSMEHIGSYWKLNNDSGPFLIFDTIREKLFKNKGGYDEYNLRCDHTEYCWVRRGRFFDFIHRGTGESFSLPGIVMAYDTEAGMFGKNENGTISLFEESGIENVIRLRQMVCEAGGYLTLTNYTYNIQHVIDVYGNILNI